MKKKVKKQISTKVIVIMIILSLLFLCASLIINNSVNKEIKNNKNLAQNNQDGSNANIGLIINPPAKTETN